MKITEDTTFKELLSNKKISDRLYNCMKYRKLRTIQEARIYFESNISPMLDNLKYELEVLFRKVYGKKPNNRLKQGQNLNVVSPAPIKKNNHIVYDNNITLQELNKKGLLSNRLYNCLSKSGFILLKDVFDYLMDKKDINVFLKINNFGRTSLSELKTLLSQNKASQFLEDNCVFQNSFYERYNLIYDNLLYSNEINNYYDELKRKSTGRVRKFLVEYLPTVDDALSVYFGSKNIVYKHYQYGKRTIDNVHSIVKSLYIFISELLYTNVDTFLINSFRNKFPFLLSEDINFVLSFYKKYLHLPMFFVLYKYLITSNGRFEKIFCSYNGINCEPKSLRRVAKEYGYKSAEAIRIILRSNNVKDPKMLTSKEWDKYDFFDKIVFEPDVEFGELILKENLYDLSFPVFMSLCSLKIKIDLFDINGKTYYLSDKLQDCFDIKNSNKDIRNAIMQKKSENVIIPISVFIDTYILKQPKFDKTIIYDLIKNILVECYGIKVHRDKAVIEQNCIDRKKELYKIIEDNNAPMHINDIRIRLIAKYPEFADITIANIRSDLQRHPNIKSIGRKSTYVIDKWKVYTGTIKELLYRMLDNSDKPISIKVLFDLVVLLFPTTTEKSIASLLSMDKKIVKFEGGLYGMYNKQYSDEYKVCNNIRHPLTFEERCDEYENFVVTHHHSPQFNGTEEEKSLLRWYNNVISGRICTTEKQLIKFNNMMQKYSDYLMTGEEYRYYRCAKDFFLFVEENYRLPSEDDIEEIVLYKWFYRQLGYYEAYEDKRKRIFEELLLTLEEFGFIFK